MSGRASNVKAAKAKLKPAAAAKAEPVAAEPSVAEKQTEILWNIAAVVNDVAQLVKSLIERDKTAPVIRQEPADKMGESQGAPHAEHHDQIGN